jgi:hypothetical protein
LVKVNRFSIDDPDVNVVDMDDGIEREDNNSNRQSTNETTSSTADHRYVQIEIKNQNLIFFF